MEINDEIAAAPSAKANVKKKKNVLSRYEGIICLVVVFGLFYYLGQVMGMANMLKVFFHNL